MKKKILICGGSTGWGAYLAKNFRKDYSVIVNSRKNSKVNRICAKNDDHIFVNHYGRTHHFLRIHRDSNLK